MNQKTKTNNEPIDREKILAQREGLEATLKELLQKVAFYQGAITSLDYLLNPEAAKVEPESAAESAD